MTEEAKALLEMTVKLWDKFMRLPKQHKNDAREFATALHQIQHMIMIRPTRRNEFEATYSANLEWVD